MPTSESEKKKYIHPKILLLDLESAQIKELKDSAYNISIGSLGTPYAVKKSSELYPVLRKHIIPQDYKEHDIVIIDLKLGNIANVDTLENINISPEVNYWWVDHEYGLVNPRLLNGDYIQNDLNRIFDTGGVFIVFSAEKFVHEFHWGYKSLHGLFHLSDRSKKISNWSFLGITNNSKYFNIGRDHGTVINLSEDVDKDSVLGRFLSKYLEDANFNCTVGPGFRTENDWLNLLVNKFGDSVGGVLNHGNSEGMVFIFPEIKEKSKFILELIKEVLPTIKPNLFPEIENNKWTNWPEYELSKVKELNQEIKEVRIEARKKILALQDQIEKVNQKNSFLFDLITETGDNLVAAVINTLQLLGFENVIDVDEEIKNNEESGQKREDLKILDLDEILISEVKGISNHPSDEDALTVQKYVILRMREWDKTNIKGLSIINSQRHLPPLERDNTMPFRKEILENAIEQKIGLLTTWDLHRITRNFLKLGWKHDQIKHLFYQNGRIHPVPNHYKFIGTIERYIEDINVIGVLIKEDVLNNNDKIAFELPLFFEEQMCESIEFENNPILKAEKGMLVGIKTHLKKVQVQLGIKVYRVENK